MSLIDEKFTSEIETIRLKYHIYNRRELMTLCLEVLTSIKMLADRKSNLNQSINAEELSDEIKDLEKYYEKE